MRYWRTRRLVLGILSAGVLSALAAGCETPQAQKARRTREQAMARSLDMVGSLDEHRSEQLAHTTSVIAKREREDEKAIRKDMNQIGYLFDEEFKNWEKKEPGIRRAIGHQLEGDDASIERTAPHFVY